MDFCSQFYNYSYSLMYITVTPVGFVLNALSLIGLFKSSDWRTKCLFKYFLAKSIFETMLSTTQLINYGYIACGDCFLLQNYWTCKWLFIVIYEYINRVCALISMMCEVAANFDRYRNLVNYFKFMNKIPFWCKMTAMILFCMIYYIGYVPIGECVLKKSIIVNNQTISTFSYIKVKSFVNGPIFYAVQLISRLMRDVISTVALIILNILIIIFMRRAVDRKRHLTSHSANNHHLEMAEKAQSRTTQMVLLTSLLSILGHTFEFSRTFVPDLCVNAIAQVLYQITYSFSFVVYFIYLKSFQDFYLHLFNDLIRLASFGRIKIFSENDRNENNTKSIVDNQI